jgi:DNA-binding HxlR family transcriptional regulator
MNENCTINKSMDYLSKKWTFQILLELHKGKSQKKRYSEIKKNMKDISPKVLSSRLKELENQGLISKNIDVSCFPVKCEYSLTDSGRDFIKIIKNIKDWSLRWKINNKSCSEQDCQYCEI